MNQLALSPDERAAHAFYAQSILRRMDQAGIKPDTEDAEQMHMGVMRDIQARRIPPNTRVPARRDVLNYLQTVTRATGSFTTAVRALLSPGSWTTSGGSHKLAHDNDIPLAPLMSDIHDNQGNVRFLEVGGGYAGLHGRERQEYEPRGVGELIAHFGDKVGATVDIHVTNLSQWHKNLPQGLQEHAGFIGATLGELTKDGVAPESVDIIYSQCAVYFDRRIGTFIEQAAKLVRKSERGGYLIFNGKTEEDETITEAAAANGFALERKKVLGQNNGTFYIFRKQ